MALLEIDLELLGRTVQGDAAGLAGEALNRAQSVGQKRARSVASPASGQAPADRARRGSSRASARAVAVRHRHHVHARQRPGNASAGSDAVPVPGRPGSAAERPQIQPCAARVGGLERRRERARVDHRRRRRGFDVSSDVGQGTRADQHGANGWRPLAARSRFARSQAPARGCS